MKTPSEDLHRTAEMRYQEELAKDAEMDRVAESPKGPIIVIEGGMVVLSSVDIVVVDEDSCEVLTLSGGELAAEYLNKALKARYMRR